MEQIIATLRAKLRELKKNRNEIKKLRRGGVRGKIGQIEERGWSTQVALIHLPPEEAMPIQQMVDAVRIVIEVLDP